MSENCKMVSATTLTDAELARVVEQRAKTAAYDHDSECLREAAARFVSQSDRIRTLTAEVERLRGALEMINALPFESLLDMGDAQDIARNALKGGDHE